MRLWSFHPKYLDNVGLSRAINEGISGYKALVGKQKMWRNHSQLKRFKDCFNPDVPLQVFILALMDEWYNKRLREINYPFSDVKPVNYGKLTVTEGQLMYEWQLYLDKLEKQKGRELPEHYKDIIVPEPHPLFDVVDGSIEDWERVRQDIVEAIINKFE